LAEQSLNQRFQWRYREGHHGSVHRMLPWWERVFIQERGGICSYARLPQAWDSGLGKWIPPFQDPGTFGLQSQLESWVRANLMKSRLAW